jgi:hypothetical protein
MRKTALLIYILIICINTFLFIPTLFYPFIIIPLHYFLALVTYDYLLYSKYFSTCWNKNIFAAIPVVTQSLLSAIIISANSGEIFTGIFHFLFPLPYYCGVSFIEFFIIRWRFERYRRLKQIS